MKDKEDPRLPEKTEGREPRSRRPYRSRRPDKPVYNNNISIHLDDATYDALYKYAVEVCEGNLSMAARKLIRTHLVIAGT